MRLYHGDGVRGGTPRRHRHVHRDAAIVQLYTCQHCTAGTREGTTGWHRNSHRDVSISLLYCTALSLSHCNAGVHVREGTAGWQWHSHRDRDMSIALLYLTALSHNCSAGVRTRRHHALASAMVMFATRTSPVLESNADRAPVARRRR